MPKPLTVEKKDTLKGYLSTSACEGASICFLIKILAYRSYCRYKFLAFDYDENVELTGDNCRLLMIRLKMEGWTIGKTKIFLKYYNEEYLSRLYETQIRKIVKVQSILRGFLVKCKLAKQEKKLEKECSKF